MAKKYSTILLLIMALLICIVSIAPEAGARGKKKNKGKSKQKTKEQQRQSQLRSIESEVKSLSQTISNAARALAIAQARGAAASAKLNVSNGRMSAALASSESLALEARSASDDLQDIEADLESAHGEGSSFHRAKTLLEEAKKQANRERNRIVNSTQYQRGFALAKKSSSPAVAINKLNRELFDDDKDYRMALQNLDLSEKRYSNIRREFTESDERWTSAAKRARAIRVEEAAAKQNVKSAALHRGSANIALREAQKIAFAAQSALVSAKSQIVKLQASKKKLQKSSSSSKSKSGKKKK